MSVVKSVCIVAAIIIGAVAQAAASVETVRVKGRGIGEDKSAALKDAYRDAVERAVGLYVDAEQMVENDEIVKDRILTQSNAFIEKYKIISLKTNRGLVNVEILATVRKGELSHKLREFIPVRTQKLVDASQDLHAEIVTELNMKLGAKELLAKELASLSPIRQLMNVSLASVKPKVEEAEDGTAVKLWYPVSIRVNSKRYFNDFIPRFDGILNQIKTDKARRLEFKNNTLAVKGYGLWVRQLASQAKRQCGNMTICDRSGGGEMGFRYCGIGFNKEYRGVCFPQGMVFGAQHILRGIWSYASRNMMEQCLSTASGREVQFNAYLNVLDYFAWVGNDNPVYDKQADESIDFEIGLVKKAEGDASSLTGLWYRVNPKCIELIYDWQAKQVGSPNSPEETTCEMHLFDEQGAEIAGTDFQVVNSDVMNFSCLGRGGFTPHDRFQRVWLVTPLVGGFSKELIRWVGILVEKDDVLKIHSAKVGVK